MPLNDTLIKNTKPGMKPITLFDGGGLYLLVNSNGSKWWRLKYYHQKKARLLSLGVYPAVSLREARKHRDAIKESLAAGIDPSEQRKQDKEAVKAEKKLQDSLFEHVAREWFSSYSPSLTPKHAIKLNRYLETIFIPSLGGLRIDQIEPADILAVIRLIESKGNITTAHKLMNLCGQVFAFAHLTGRIRHNPAVGLSKAIQPERNKHLAAITKPEEIAHLLKDIDSLEAITFPSIFYYLKLLPYLFTRPSELRLARWSEIDFDNALFTIPADRMKMRKEHVVPLPDQVMTLLKTLYSFYGDSPFVFPGIRTKTIPISDAGPMAALRRLGYQKEKMSLHGFRAMASTRLNEMGFRGDVIEAALAHKEPDAVRLAYNRAQYMEERRKMMQEWADYLDELRASE
jgi:integrase